MNTAIRRIFALFVLGLLALLVPQPVVAYPDVTFLSEQELSVSFEKTEEGIKKIDIEILNGTETAKTITLDYVDMFNEKQQAISSEALNIYSKIPHNPSSNTITIEANQQGVYTFTLEIDPTKFTGTYSGQLVIRSSEEPLDYRILTVSVKDPSPSQPLDLDLLEEITFIGKNPCPSVELLLLSLCQGQVQIESKPVDKADKGDNELPPEGAGENGGEDEPEKQPPTVGEVASVNGGEGKIVKHIEGGNVSWTVEGLSKAGEYTGKIDLTPEEEGEEVTVKVLVRDTWIWPLWVLVIGLAVSWLLGWLGNYQIPRLRLKIKFQDLLERACPKELKRAQDEQPQKCKGRKYEIGELLMKEEETFLKNFTEGWRDEELRQRWGPNGEEIKRVTEYVEVLDTLDTLEEKSSITWEAIKILLKGFDYLEDIPEGNDGYSTKIAVKTFLKDGSSHPVYSQLDKYCPSNVNPIKESKDLTDCQDGLSDAKIFLESFFLVLFDLTKDIRRTKPQTSPAASNHFVAACTELRKLLSNQVKNSDHVQLISSALQGSRLRNHEVFREVRDEDSQIREADSLSILTDSQLISSYRPMSQTIFESVPKINIRTGSSSVVKLKYQLFQSSLVFSLLSMIIVIVGAFSVLYWGKSSFGSPADYAGMFLWATATDRIIKLIGSFLPNLLGNLSKPA